MKKLILLFIALSFFSCGDEHYRSRRSSTYSSYGYGDYGYYGYEPELRSVTVRPSSVYEYEYFNATFYYDDPDADIVAICLDISACGTYYGWDCFAAPYNLWDRGSFTQTFCSPPYCYWQSRQVLYWYLVDSRGNESNAYATSLYVY